MEFLTTNPWFIVFTVINIGAIIFLSIMFYYKSKTYEPMSFDRLRDVDVNITIKTSPKQSDFKGDDT